MAVVTRSDIDLGAIERRAQQLGLGLGDLAAIIGVHETTLWRWRQREAPTGRALVSSRLAQIGEMLELLRRLFAGPDLARTWLRESHPASFGGSRTPLDVLRDGRIDKVLTLLNALAAGG